MTDIQLITVKYSMNRSIRGPGNHVELLSDPPRKTEKKLIRCPKRDACVASHSVRLVTCGQNNKTSDNDHRGANIQQLTPNTKDSNKMQNANLWARLVPHLLLLLIPNYFQVLPFLISLSPATSPPPATPSTPFVRIASRCSPLLTASTIT